jgi:hypothetical protein
MRRIVVLLMLLLLPAASGFADERKKVANRPPLRMEQLEVRGIREKPEILYVPVHRETLRPSQVRYDLFVVDMLRPVTPGDLEAQMPSRIGTTD